MISIHRLEYSRLSRLLRATLVIVICCCLSSVRAQEVAAQIDPAVPPEILAMQIKHLEVDELKAEAGRWQQLLKKTVRELNLVKSDIHVENLALEDDQANQADEQAEADQALKDESLDQLAVLREERVQVIDRFNVVLDELSRKLGRTESDDEQEEVLVYRRYIDAVDSVEVDTSDYQAVRSALATWLVSPEGGKRWARNLAKFAGTVLVFWLLSLLLGKLIEKAMSLAQGASMILRGFVANSVRRVILIIGVVLGLAALEVNITPLVAVIGAIGFVVAFALQNTLSNFASGLMIMFYKPFDIGDFVQTSEVMGTVKSMTLVTTNMLTPDNKLLVVPNNELWGKVVTNVTGSSERRVDMIFGIGYGDDIELAERVLREVVEAHPAVLEEPEPVIAVSELADSSVNLICRPWVKTTDYWKAYWDITRAVKERFDAEGISIPFPQRDVNIVGGESKSG